MTTTPFPFRGRLMPAAMLALCCAPAAHAVGYRLPNQDPEGIARGNAFVATADNPSAIYYNPAGITQLEGNDLSVGVYVISTDVSFQGAGGGSASTDTAVQFVPQIYYVHSPANSDFSFGLGIYAPYGLGIDYGRYTPFPTAAQDAELAYATVNPVLAWEVTPGLSVAAGLTYNRADVHLERRIGLIPNDYFEFDGNGDTTGFNLGVLYQPVDQWSFGLNYRSPTEVKFKGRSVTAPVPPFGRSRAYLPAVHRRRRVLSPHGGLEHRVQPGLDGLGQRERLGVCRHLRRQPDLPLPL
jgi:long-chain fatty acid transport protein